MKCPECGNEMTTRIENNFRYTASGLSNVVLAGIEVRSCSCGEEEVVIPRIDNLHRAIATAIVSKHSRLAPEEVRFLRKVLGLSGADFAARMGVDPSTVSRWENGHDTIGRQADGLLRLMVALEPPKVDYHAEELAKIRDEVKPAAVRLEPRSRGWAEARA